MLNGQAAPAQAPVAPAPPRLRFLADIVNRGDSPEANRLNLAHQLRGSFPTWLEDGRTRTLYEYHPSIPFPPASLEDFLDPDYLAAFLKRVPEWLAVHGVEAVFDGVLAWDLETFTGRVELSTNGTLARWSGRFPETPYPLGYETVVSRVLAEIGRYVPKAKRVVWGFPWLATWLDQSGPASVGACRAWNAKWGPSLVRSFECLNPAFYATSPTGPMRPLFDEVAVMTNQVRPPGMEAWADVSMTYATGALPADQQAAQPPGGVSLVPISAQHLDDACSAAVAGRFTGVTLWGPVWNQVDLDAKARWMREVFEPVSRRYARTSVPEAA